MEDELMKAMRIIDKHSDKMPEGDYLSLCNIMRDVYKGATPDTPEPVGARSVFPEAILVDDVELDDESVMYFQTHYENKMRCVDIDIKQAEMKIIDNIIKNTKIIQKTTTSVMRLAIRYYCESHNLYLDDYSAEEYLTYLGTRRDLDSICRSFIATENRYRNTLIRDLHRRWTSISDEIDLIRRGYI
jgi:hypothetical protein